LASPDNAYLDLDYSGYPIIVYNMLQAL